MRRELKALLVCAVFWLGISGGRVVWEDADGLHDSGIDAACLPEADRSLLENGLHFEDRAALTRSLEDFCG